MGEEEKQAYLLYLDSLGIKPTNVKVQIKAGEAQEERLVYPAALVHYNGKSARNRSVAGTGYEWRHSNIKHRGQLYSNINSQTPFKKLRRKNRQ